MGNITKAEIGEQDLQLWDGITATFTRDTSTGDTLTLNKIGHEVDALMVYGGGVNYTLNTLVLAKAGIGTTNKVRLVLRPGIWTITDNLTITSNLTLAVPPGATLAITAGKTLTVNGMIDAGPYRIFTGSGTATVTTYPQEQAWWGNAQRIDTTGAYVTGKVGIGTTTPFGALDVKNGYVVIGGQENSRPADIQLQVQGNASNTLPYRPVISLYNTTTPGDNVAEAGLDYTLNDSAGAPKQVASISAMWSNNATVATGYGVLRLNVDTASGTGDVAMRLFSGKGITLFGASETDAPGIKALMIRRTTSLPSIVGATDMMIDANYGGTAQPVTINAVNAGDVVLALGGGSIGIGKATPGHLIDCETSGGGYYSVSDHAWHTGSSLRWKENVKDIGSGLEIVSKLRPVTFDWKKEHGGQKGIGFIAEEVNEILPEVVHMSTKDKGHADGMDYGKLTAVLVSAVQELTKKVNELEAQLKAAPVAK